MKMCSLIKEQEVHTRLELLHSARLLMKTQYHSVSKRLEIAGKAQQQLLCSGWGAGLPAICFLMA